MTLCCRYPVASGLQVMTWTAMDSGSLTGRTSPWVRPIIYDGEAVLSHLKTRCPDKQQSLPKRTLTGRAETMMDRTAPCLAKLSSSCTASSQFFPNVELKSALWKHSFLQCAHWLNLAFCPLSLPSSLIGVRGWVAKPNSLGLGLQELGLLPRNSIYISNIQGSQIANFHNIKSFYNKEKKNNSEWRKTSVRSRNDHLTSNRIWKFADWY